MPAGSLTVPVTRAAPCVVKLPRTGDVTTIVGPFETTAVPPVVPGRVVVPLLPVAPTPVVPVVPGLVLETVDPGLVVFPFVPEVDAAIDAPPPPEEEPLEPQPRVPVATASKARLVQRIEGDMCSPSTSAAP
jgi:hypothetical protein